MIEPTFNQQEAAHALSVSTRTLRSWDELPDPPPRTQGKRGKANVYPARELIAWFLEYRISQLIGDVDGTPLNLEQERAKLARVQTLRQEHALERERGEVVLIEDAAAVWMQIAGTIRSHLLAIPGKVAPLTAAESSVAGNRQIVEAEIHESLEELSQRQMGLAGCAGELTEDGGQGVHPPESAAHPDS